MSRKKWEKWEGPSDDELLQLARILMPYIKLLSPEIVQLISKDNNEKGEKWSDEFRQLGIAPEVYLWENSPVAFPGVRRHSGNLEISNFRSPTGAKYGENAIIIDDNTYPKEIWSILLKGVPFGKQGPEGYSLAHILDHKDYHSRNFKELKGSFPKKGKHVFSGLFTSAANTMWVPKDLLKPTDHNDKLRLLLIQLINRHYSDFCSLLPFGLEFNFSEVDEKWDINNFKEAPQFVGNEKYIKLFLEYREEKIESAIEKVKLQM